MIEPAKVSDFQAIAALNVAAYEQFSSHLADGAWSVMRQNVSNIAERAKSSEFLVYREGGAIVASVAYGPAGCGDPAIFRPGMASVLLLAVHPQHRGKGLAKALTQACIVKAKQDGASSIGLFTGEIMASAHRLYKGLGFVLESELPPRYGIRYFRFVLPLDTQSMGD